MGQVVTPAFYAINVSLRLFTTHDFLFSLSLLDTSVGLRVCLHNMGLIKREFLPQRRRFISLVTKNNHSGRKAKRYYVLYRSKLSHNTVASNIAAI